MILCIIPYLVHSNVLFPYILSISERVGHILEESLKLSMDLVSIQAMVGFVLKWFEDIIMFSFLC